MVPPRRRSPAPVRRLQRQARVQLAVPGRRSRLRAGPDGLTPNRSAVPWKITSLTHPDAGVHRQ
jgi:hypothetical protein